MPKTQQRVRLTPTSIAEQIEDAKLQVAKSALSNPGMYHEGNRVHQARLNFAKAKQELADAEKAWANLIAPAKDWNPPTKS